MGVLDKLGSASKAALHHGKAAAKTAIKKNVTKSNAKKFALKAGARLAKTAWDWSGANELGVVQDTVAATSKAYKFLKDQHDADGDGMDDETGDPMRSTPRLENNPSPAKKRNNNRQGVKPRPAALLPPDRPSNQETRERRKVSAETREKQRVASKANAVQRNATRLANLAMPAKPEAADTETPKLLGDLTDKTEKSGAVQVKIYDELDAIHTLMLREANPLLQKKGQGALTQSLLGAATSRIPGLGGLVGGLAGGAIGGKLLGKAGGLAAKIPGGKLLGKVAGMAIPGLAGLAIPGLGGFAGGADADAATSTGAKARGKGASGATGLAGAARDVTDVVAKPAAGTVAKSAGKGLGKMALKKLPVIGALAGIGFGISRAAKGDWAGAGMEVASGVASLAPGVGTAASFGIDAAIIARDAKKEDEKQKERATVIAAEEKAAEKKIGPDGKYITTNKEKAVTLAPLSPPPETTGVQRREAVLAATAPSRPETTRNPGSLAASLASAPVPSSGAASTWRQPTKTEEDVRVIDLLTTLSSAMLNRDKGIFVKPAKDVFGGGDDPFAAAPGGGEGGEGGEANGVAVKAEGAKPNLSTDPTPTAKPSQVKVAPIGGSGFTPNAERPEAPRPYLGGGAVPTPRVDISKAVAKDASVAIKAPSSPTVGVKGAGKGFKGFGDETDAHIKEASEKYGIGEDVLRGFVKMEGGWNGAMSPTGAIGTGQFIQPTWDGLAAMKEGKEIGMEKIGSRFRKEDDPRRDKRTNTLATGLLAKQNAAQLKANGLEATGENLYMMHNIGPGVMQAMKGGKVNAATEKAMSQNGMKPGMTPKDFVEYQKQRYNSHYAQANAPEVIAAAKNSGVTSSPVATAAAKPEGKTASVAGVTAPRTTAAETNALALASSQREANRAAAAQPAPIIVAGGGGGGKQHQASRAAGDAKPNVVVRNNESSLSRVTDNLISRTIS